jgi:hypothetical protein
MQSEPFVESQGLGSEHSMGVWTRIYLHGAIVLAVLCALGYVLTLLR